MSRAATLALHFARSFDATEGPLLTRGQTLSTDQLQAPLPKRRNNAGSFQVVLIGRFAED